MNGIEKITGRIEDDAQREIDALLNKAKAEAEEITTRYSLQAGREADDIVRRGKKAADERVERLGSVAQLEARKLTLAAKQEVLDEAFALAQKKLCTLPDGEYVSLLASLAVKAARTGREQVIFSQKDRTRVGKAVVTKANELLAKQAAPQPGQGMLTLAEESRPIQGGLILSDGEVETNCTFETLVRLLRDEMSGEVAKALFQ